LETDEGAYIAEKIVVRNCRPPGNRTPTFLEKHCCSIHLEEDIRNHPYKAVLLVGGVPLSMFIPGGDASITQIHGVRFPIEIGGVTMWGYPVFHPSFVVQTGGDRSAQFPCFQADLSRFFRDVDGWRDPVVERVSPTDVIVSRDEKEVRSIVDKMGGVLGFDIETKLLKPYMRESAIITGSFSDGKTTVAFPAEHPSDPNSWAIPLMLEITSRRPWVAHQLQFEFIWMLAMAQREGIDWQPAEMHDSMALGRLYHNRDVLLGLDILSRIILGTNIKALTNINTRRIMDHALEEVLPYNGLDSWASARIQRHLVGKVHEYNYMHLIRAQQSAARMELLGLPTDSEYARELRTEWEKKIAASQAEAEALYEVKSFVREKQKEFSLSKPEQVASALMEYGRVELPLTPGSMKEGAKKRTFVTDDNVLGPLAATNPLARCTLEYREATKLCSTYVDPVLHDPLGMVDGLLHPSYTSMKTSTLRRSSEGPNIQNWHKRKHKEVRGMIPAPPGCVILACDSGQIQARVFGMASKDRALIDSFINHSDIHSYWLDRILEIYPPYMDRLMSETNTTDESKIRKVGRNVIKYDFVFASFFGQIARSCAEKTGIPLFYVQQVLEEFWGGYPQAHKWLKARRKEYQETGGVYTLTGRFRYGVMPGNEPIITPIQGGEAELVIAAECDLSEMAVRERDPYLQPRIMVHDDLTAFVPDHDDKIDMYMKIYAEAMNRVRFNWQIVPLTTEVQIGYRWDDLHEIAVIEGDYIR
jgi:DNA polymerase-1